MTHPKRTFTNKEKYLIFNLWKQGPRFSNIGRIFEAPPGTIFTILRKTGGIKPPERCRNITHLTGEKREDIRQLVLT